MKLWTWIIALFTCTPTNVTPEVIREIIKPDRSKRKWTPAEIFVLENHWEDNQSIAYIAAYMDRSEAGVKRKLNALGYSTKKDAPKVSKYDVVFRSIR